MFPGSAEEFLYNSVHQLDQVLEIQSCKCPVRSQNRYWYLDRACPKRAEFLKIQGFRVVHGC